MTPPLTAREVAMMKVLRLADELCVSLDNQAEDIGGNRPAGDILKELGPAVDAALEATATLPPEPAAVPESVMEPCVQAFDAYNDGFMDADEALCLMATALQIVAAAPKPEGWKLVPVEPTEAMCAAAGRALDGQNLTKMGRKARAHYKAAVRYRAMLAAAPKPEGK
jgi:hypothetical protein